VEYLESPTANRFYEEHRNAPRARKWETPGRSENDRPKADATSNGTRKATEESGNANPNKNSE
jgi:hypothetical protein